MKTTINATRVIPRRIMCLALSLVAMAALALRSQAADRQVPFNAAFTDVFVSDGNFPIARITVIGEGQATPLGKATTATTNQLVNLNTGESTATYTFAAANGDTVVLEEKFLSTFDSTSGRVTFDGTYVVTGGTGRFAGATGQWDVERLGRIYGSKQWHWLVHSARHDLVTRQFEVMSLGTTESLVRIAGLGLVDRGVIIESKISN